VAGRRHVAASAVREPLDGIVLEPGTAKALTLPGTTIQLSNKGGIITLLNSAGLKVHGVHYNKKDVSDRGGPLFFISAKDFALRFSAVRFSNKTHK
jgi:hypothetical protein